MVNGNNAEHHMFIFNSVPTPNTKTFEQKKLAFLWNRELDTKLYPKMCGIFVDIYIGLKNELITTIMKAVGWSSSKI